MRDKKSNQQPELPTNRDTWIRTEEINKGDDKSRRSVIYTNSTPCTWEKPKNSIVNKFELIYDIATGKIEILHLYIIPNMQDYTQNYRVGASCSVLHVSPFTPSNNKIEDISIKDNLSKIIQFLFTMEKIADINPIKEQLIDDLQIYSSISEKSYKEKRLTSIDHCYEPMLRARYLLCFKNEFKQFHKLIADSKQHLRKISSTLDQEKVLNDLSKEVNQLLGLSSGAKNINEAIILAYNKAYTAYSAVSSDSTRYPQAQLQVRRLLEKALENPSLNDNEKAELKDKSFECLYNLYYYYRNFPNLKGKNDEDFKHLVNRIYYNDLLGIKTLDYVEYFDGQDHRTVFNNIVETFFSEEQKNDIDFKKYEKLIEQSKPVEAFMEIAKTYRKLNTENATENRCSMRKGASKKPDKQDPSESAKVTDTWIREEDECDGRKYIYYKNLTPLSEQHPRNSALTELTLSYEEGDIEEIGFSFFHDSKALETNPSARDRFLDRREEYELTYSLFLNLDNCKGGFTLQAESTQLPIDIESPEKTIQILHLIEKIADIDAIKEALIDDLQIDRIFSISGIKDTLRNVDPCYGRLLFRGYLRDLKNQLDRFHKLIEDSKKVLREIPSAFGQEKVLDDLSNKINQFLGLSDAGNIDQVIRNADLGLYFGYRNIWKSSTRYPYAQLRLRDLMIQTLRDPSLNDEKKAECEDKLFEHLYNLYDYYCRIFRDQQSKEYFQELVNRVYHHDLLGIKTTDYVEYFDGQDRDLSTVFDNIVQTIFSEEQRDGIPPEEKCINSFKPEEAFIRIAKIYRELNKKTVKQKNQIEEKVTKVREPEAKSASKKGLNLKLFAKSDSKQPSDGQSDTQNPKENNQNKASY